MQKISYTFKTDVENYYGKETSKRKTFKVERSGKKCPFADIDSVYCDIFLLLLDYLI